MRLSLNASTIRGTPILRQIEIAALAGYGAIELWFTDVDEHLAKGGTVDELRRAVDDRRLSVPTLIYFGGWLEAPEDEWPQIKESASRRLELTAQLGAHYMIACPPEGRAEVPLAARRYRELLEIGDGIGAWPAFEFLGFVEQYKTIESAHEVLTLAHHPKAATVLDPFHIFRGGGTLEAIATLRSDQIAVAHFNDTPTQPRREQQHDRDRVWPGDGHLDLHRYVALLTQIGYTGSLSLELFREDLWRQNPLDVARAGMERIQMFAGRQAAVTRDDRQ
jgi:2-keto-myo-inositol isomerase